MQWCIRLFPKAETIFDPYCGSGTTLVAAKKLGRHFLGFEISEEYCKIARERIARIEAQPGLFEPRAEQIKLL
jgi:DNA modification methylase